jgi:hypothetical protein
MTENMNTHLKYFRIVCIAIISFCLIALIIGLSSCKQNYESDLQVGQTWVYTPKDPFSDKAYKQIVDIKGDYVQYKLFADSTLTKFGIHSCSKYIFLVGNMQQITGKQIK